MTSTEATVVDASAALALLQNERGAEIVLDALPGAVWSTVNRSEVIAKLAERGMDEQEIRATLSLLAIETRPFTAGQADRAGFLRPLTRRRGLSLGDRACLALGLELDAPVLTADRQWAKVDVGVDVRVIR